MSEDPGMYGSDVNKASDLLYEVAAWLHDVAHGAAVLGEHPEFDVMYEALIDRLVPTADAALDEIRRYASMLDGEREEHREAEQYLALSCHLGDISSMVTGSYPAGLDPELVMRRRVNKIGNEYGEMLDALEGFTGENPRKGFYATADDVIKELLDCASASLCAVEHLTGDEGRALGLLAAQVAMQTERLRLALATSTPAAPAPDATHP